MSDAQSQLAEVDALIAASPDEPSLLQLREDLLQLIALEEQEKSNNIEAVAVSAPVEQQEQIVESHSLGHQHVDESNNSEVQSSVGYAAQSKFTDNVDTNNSLAEAPDLGSFQPVVKSSYKSTIPIASQANLKSAEDNDDIPAAAAATAQPTEKKKKKKKKSESDDSPSTFELPNHLILLDSDTDAQRQKKQRAAKSLKSKFRAKQKEKEQTKRANDWKSFASKTSKKKKKVGGKSIFSTEEGVNAKVGVMRGGR